MFNHQLRPHSLGFLCAHLCALICLAVGLNGCSNLDSAPAGGLATAEVSAHQTQIPNQQQTQSYWHAVRFRMPRDEQGQPVWAMDLLLADQVIEPMLTAMAEPIALWRFHRRAGRDKAGHQFSFIFYASEATAQQVFTKLEQHPLIMAKPNGLNTVLYQSRAYTNAEQLQATSDQRWHKAIQEHWPHYMTGVSQMWLGLVRSLSDEQLHTQTPPQSRSKLAEQSFDQTLAHYQAVHEHLGQLWREQGQHAFLHHLSASFGYQPIFFGNLIQF